MITCLHRWRAARLLAFVLLLLLALPGGSALAWGAQDTGQDSVQRRLDDEVIESVYTLVTGPGTYDRIRLHRLHRDDARHHGGPKRRQAVLLVHGDAWGFSGAFMTGDRPQQTFAYFLAQRGIDVWGIDLAWTLVPAGETDTSFMASWGLQHDLDDITAGLNFARERRESEGQGRGPLALLGWSRGAQMGYALLNQEAKRSRHHRLVDAFVVVDMMYKIDDEQARSRLCQWTGEYEALLAQGQYAEDEQLLFWLGQLSQSDPDGESPVFGPPFTNRSASLVMGSSLFQYAPSLNPWYHFVAATYAGNDSSTMPTGLRFTDIARWDAFEMAVSRYMPNRLLAEASAILCGATTGPFDDRLGDIEVPVLYVGAAGGIGTYGLHTLSLLGSRDRQVHMVRRFAPGQERLDFGHVDLFLARDADRLAWSRIHRWLAAHGQRR